MKKGLSAVLATAAILCSACTSQISAEEAEMKLSNKDKAVCAAQ